MNTENPFSPIYKVTPPKRPNEENLRSLTASSSQAQYSNSNVPKIERPHHHHRPHIHRHHKDGKDGKEKDSGLGLMITKESHGESEFVTPEESRNPSRGTSLLENGAGTQRYEVEGLPLAPSWKDERRVVREVEVAAEKEKGVLRATELRNALNNLKTLSNNTTRRLNNTYYSVLEKLSTFQSTITSLKELATMTRGLEGEFTQEADEVVREVETSVDGYEGFEEQGKRIEGLAERVRKGREKIKTLAERVETVRERVDGWEKAEGEWQDRKRKRLRVLWMVIAGCWVVICGALAFQYAPARMNELPSLEGLNASESGGALPDLERIRYDTWTLKRSTEDALEKMKAQSRENESEEEDPRLRMFDEL